MATGGGDGGGEGMEDYLSEISDIQQGKDSGGTSQSDDELSKTPDEGEQEMFILNQAGFGHYVAKHTEGKEISDEELNNETSALPPHQREAVRRRVNTLNATLKKNKHKHQARGDVRDVFAAEGRSSVVISLPDLNVVGNHPHVPPESGSRVPGQETRLSRRLSNRVSSQAPPGLHITTSIPEYSATRNSAFSLSSLLQPGGGVSGGNKSHPSSADGNRHHSEPGLMYTTDIPTQNPNVGSTKHASLSSSGSSSGGGRHAATKASIIKSRGEYSIQKSHRSADDTGIATIGFKREENGDWDRNQVQLRQKTNRDARIARPAATVDLHAGVTRMDDLGLKDRVKVRSLALMEMTAMFDEHNVTYTRRKRKKKVKDHGWFGVPLQTLLDRDRKKNGSVRVPTIFSQLIQFLEKTGLDEEGILRVPGSVSRIRELRGQLDEGFDNGKFRWEDVRPNDAAGLLKQFLRELPVPLLTLDYMEAFAQVERIPKKEDQVAALNLLSLLLPDVHLETLLMLLEFLKKVVDCQKNKMNITNVAMIIAPNLFAVASKRNKTPSAIDFQMAVGTATIVRMLIENQFILSTVPSFMVDQVRQQYEAEQARKPRDKSIMKFLIKKDKNRAPAIVNEADFNNGIVQIHLPGKPNPTAVQLDTTMSVRQVLDKCCRMSAGESADSSGSKVHLYEVGGNIGERRLDPQANMETLYRRNPNAEWTVRS